MPWIWEGRFRINMGQLIMGILLFVLLELVPVGARNTYVANHRTASQLQSEGRWTNSRFCTQQPDGSLKVPDSAPLFRWPMGHDVVVYNDGTKTTVTRL